ncbi:MAG: V-type ATPase 116kDa subunit family protein [Thermodesulfovibrionales bacterium]|nr:V-type ATPase 116kDa subunit family protein [Thermodesulfovibrionales bacterium]
MIVRMSKVEIAGPNDFLQDAVSLIRETEMLQIEPSAIGFIEKGEEEYVRTFLPDKDSLSERLFLERLKSKIEEFFSYLPVIPARKSYIEPRAIIETVAETIKRHTSACRDMHQRKELLKKELAGISNYASFLDAVEHLLEDIEQTPNLEIIGLTIKEPVMLDHLKELIRRLTDDESRVVTANASNGTLAGLIITLKDKSENVKRLLKDENVPELDLPISIEGLSFTEKLGVLKRKITEISAGIEAIDRDLETVAKRWLPIYRRALEWINERLSLLRTLSSTFETRFCFFIYGWMPAEDTEKLKKKLNERFEGKVALEEKGTVEEDIERVPVILRNPPYFQPFELFMRLFPFPRYSSVDPTPFMAIFFPVFFGMILGDAGYGLMLLIISLITAKRFKLKKTVRDASKILLISSIYAVFFGVLYGEFFGELPRLIGIEPICIERRTAIMPVLYFALTVGIVHIMIGLFLGALTAFRKRAKKEVLYRLINIVIILCIITLVIAIYGDASRLFTVPVVIAIVILTPLLFFTGGLLAPLELLKTMGNIFSYARIMAIGLASVLLAFVANTIAGMTGNIALGIVVAGLLHLLNIILGIFSPAVHALRLHYVEFFSKFLEIGGRKFEPLKKNG